MERRAPAVVAVVVTTGPAPLLEATLASLEAQDYATLSVLVLANGDVEGVERTVAASCPQAFVRELAENRGFAAAANEALGMVEGAAFLCLCHDDVELAPDAVHLMVEEAYRANAGIVTPKFVRPEDPRQLLHVGLNADRFGATTERVEPGEVDQGQHDTARDVFVAPGGVTLVRADLFVSLGGFDDAIVALGEDLDLCWRAQVAGSRVVVAPGAVVAHHELLSNSGRPLAATADGAGAESLSSLARRHRLSTMLTCYRLGTLLVTCVLLLGLEAGECVIAFLGRDRERTRAIAGSWRWNLARFGQLRKRRRALRRLRVLDDHEIHRLQVAGASRLSTFGSRLVHEGVAAARGALHQGSTPSPQDEPLDHTVGFGAAFSDDQSFDELDDLGHRGGRVSLRVLSSRGTQVGLVALVVVLFVFGLRGLLDANLPLVGRLAPLGSWTGTWHRLFSSWTPAGVGSGAAGSPAFGVLGIAGTVLFGRMGLLTRGALLLSLPLGAVGVYRLLARVGSRRARVVGAIAYGLLAIGPNLIATGRLDVLASLALLPFVISRMLRVAGVAPFAGRPAHEEPTGPTAWRATRTGQLVLLGALEALIVAFDPSAAVAILVAAIGIALGGLAAGEHRAGRVLGAGLAATVVTAVLLAPLTVDALASGRDVLGIFGAAQGAWSTPGLGGLLRLATGPFGHGALSWLLPAAALLPIVVGRGERLGAAARFAGMAVCSILVASLVGRHLLGSLTPDVETLLVPYAVGVAALVGTGVASFERDVASARFGWRQLAATATLLAVLVGAAPFVSSLSTGRFDLPQYGFEAPLAALGSSPVGGTRVLWLGDPRVLPLASWTIEPGLAFATSVGQTPGASDVLAPPAPGAASVLSSDVQTALRGQTVLLGRLLAAAGVGTVAVVTATAPSLAGTQQTTAVPPPPALLAALRRQVDLSSYPGTGSGLVLFGVSESHGIIASRTEPLSPSAQASAASSARYWRPALSAGTWSGTSGPATILASLAPAGDFVATLDGASLPASSAFGWARSFTVPRRGSVRIRLDAVPLDALLAAAMLAAWVLVLAGALGADRLLRFRRAMRRLEDAASPRIARAA